MIFELYGKEYNNEQEIIDSGLHSIYSYCREVKGRWREIEHLVIEHEHYGYSYAVNAIEGRYEPEIETLYLMKHSGKWVEWYIIDLVRYGNV